MCSELTLDIALRRSGFGLEVRETIPLRGVTAISGASGSGKTSLLRIIAGLEPGAEGTVAAFDEIWQGPGAPFVPAWRRGVGLVFQDAALFAHMNVAQNLDYGRTRRRRSSSATPQGQSRDAIIGTLRLEPLLDRMPQGLSGGERQRVALGRCLMSEPRLILLDEPLSAVDHARRTELIPYLQQSLALAQVPAIHVSHSRTELRRMADRVLRMEQGCITARGGAELLLPEGAILLDARVMETGPTGTRLDIGWLTQPLANTPAGAAVRLMVRADQIVLIAGAAGGGQTEVQSAARISARITGRTEGALNLEVGRQTVMLKAGGTAGPYPLGDQIVTLALAGYELLPGPEAG